MDIHGSSRGGRLAAVLGGPATLLDRAAGPTQAIPQLATSTQRRRGFAEPCRPRGRGPRLATTGGRSRFELSRPEAIGLGSTVEHGPLTATCG